MEVTNARGSLNEQVLAGRTVAIDEVAVNGLDREQLDLDARLQRDPLRGASQTERRQQALLPARPARWGQRAVDGEPEVIPLLVLERSERPLAPIRRHWRQPCENVVAHSRPTSNNPDP